MARVPVFSRFVAPNTVDTSAISNAGQAAKGLKAAADIGLKFKQAKDDAFVAEKSLLLERQTDDLFMQYQKDAASDPEGFKKNFETDFFNLSNDLAKGASPEALKKFNLARDAVEFSYSKKYEDYSKRQSVKNFAVAYDQALTNAGMMAMREGEQGLPFDPTVRLNVASLSGSNAMSAQELKLQNTKAEKELFKNYALGRFASDPLQFEQELKSGEYDKYGADVVSTLQKQAGQAVSKQKEKAEQDRINSARLQNNDMYQKELDGTLSYVDVQEFETEQMAAAQTEEQKAAIKDYADFLKDSFEIDEIPEDVRVQSAAAKKFRDAKAKEMSKRYLLEAGLPVPEGDITPTDKANAYINLIDRIKAIGVEEENGKIKEIETGSVSLSQLLSLEAEIQKAGAAKLLTATQVRSLRELVLPAIENRTDKGFFGPRRKFDKKGLDPYTPAFNGVLDHIKGSDNDTPVNRSAILQIVTEEIEARNVENIEDPDLRQEAFDKAVEAATMKFDKQITPSLSILGDTRPQAVLKSDGSLVSTTPTEKKPKADIVVPEGQSKIVKGADGRRYRMFPDGTVQAIDGIVEATE